ncbi:acetyl-CoA carboxylase biotin carboxyl carrier protein [Enterococcus faecalis]|uniref:acetyl-CoA carboxylase biotin carboxyl carrier protein n=1 Tax=Enterococcus faecalis TaxID=1351 RepID=UPI000DE96E8B|nr:acetyl-CoA carboxylase biotin carboxyl carrier protein [Enterococcus faecalis]EGO8274281.1 acetyl-CoA carboxylase biotin carboxyl carrier protein [Enterococcus faecalis]EGO9002285.1 acetyl-CoA carboxylase biotin carboxyl carrier protein [Enterococcus faecalis]MDB1622486.1 acetyl-CoA carboxylase biotin carboxyl carrier protein [Enterococcus faecalis]NSW10271.1 acetyl-CoA carboxylase biotin carboxyl carrier protein [Enterococcus faecalis]RBR47074.1 acetyl-CoA carboxylase, biotin carboxyl carr
MQLEEVKALLTQFDQSTLTEFDLREGSFELYMNKNTASGRSGVEPVAQPQETPVASSTSSVSVPVETVSVVEETPTNTPTANEKTEEITSPIVGIVYLQPAPDKENFVKVGDTVKTGDVVCIVEAMKLMNEITATVDGVITEVLVNNEDVVEFGQPLFRVAKGE